MHAKILILLCMSMFSLTAVAASLPQASTGGLGDAKFGMNIESVEGALGQKLLFSKKSISLGVNKLDCTYASIGGIPGVSLRFERGRFTAAILSGPLVATKSGIKVGDPESAVIGKFKSDPTYQRTSNHYDEKVMEIYLGKSTFVPKGNGGEYQGRVIKFTSQRGKITAIETGEASYVMMVEHDEDCE
jgi:hypothetical protein